MAEEEENNRTKAKIITLKNEIIAKKKFIDEQFKDRIGCSPEHKQFVQKAPHKITMNYDFHEVDKT